MRKMITGFAGAGALALAVVPCRGAGEPLAKPEPNPSGKLFERMSAEATGLTEPLRLEADHAQAYLYRSGMGAGGVALGDVNGDGRLDMFIAGGAGPNKLYLQTERLKFKDVTAVSGPLLDGGTAWATGAAMVDIEGDGDLDIFVTNYRASCHLFINGGPDKDGAIVFTENAASVQLDVVAATATPSFVDYDRDGDLDLFLLTGRTEDPAGMQKVAVVSDGAGGAKVADEAAAYYEAVTNDGGKTWHAVPAGEPDILLRNEASAANGQLYFRDVSMEAGIRGRGEGECAVWWDADGDGWLDIYISNADWAPDVFYRNQRDGTFQSAAPERFNVQPWHSGVAVAGDFSGDGMPDFFAGGIGYARREDRCLAELLPGAAERVQAMALSPRQEMRSALFVAGGAAYAECAWISGAAQTGAVRGAVFTDADHDGLADWILLHGQARRFGDPGVPQPKEGQHLWDAHRTGGLQKEPLTALRNAGSLRTQNASEEWGLGQLLAGTAMTAADMDGDGDEDLVVLAFDEPPMIFRNGTTRQNSLTIRLLGTVGNPRGLGATLIAKCERGTFQVMAGPDAGSRAQRDSAVHFCTGRDPVISELTIRWPSGVEQKAGSLIAGNSYVIAYPEKPQTPPVAGPRDAFFTPRPAMERIRHTAATSTEFLAQPLLPWSAADAGPGLAWSDVDGDGDYDLYCGGAAGHAGQLRLNDGQGQLMEEFTKPFIEDRAAADAGAVWFDADGDGDVDLYAAGGSMEHQLLSPHQADRLYLNDGKGALHRAPDDAIPQDGQASSVVCVADFDRDGDFDVFTGSRGTPGDYGSPGSLQLLRNDTAGGVVKFKNVAAEMELRAPGMVTSAVWSDLDNDGWADLAVACEWGPVRLYGNRVAKRFRDMTAESGLEPVTGWWQSLAVADVDGDGDMDLFAGNAGTNSSHRAPVSGLCVRPVSGTQRLFFMAEKKGDQFMPLRSPGVFAALLPEAAGRLKGYQALAAATVADLAGAEILEAAVRLDAAVLESGVFFNTPPAKEGDAPKFEFRALPAEAQLAPVFGMAVTDFDGDSDMDVLLAQNARNAAPGEPQRDSGLCALLINDGAGAFTAMPAAASGLNFHHEHRACTVADLNFDNRPDAVLSVWRGGLLGLANTGSGGQFLRINLPPSRAPGARVKVERGESRAIVADYCAGGGWLSQSVPAIFVGLGKGPRDGVVSIRWADGTSWAQTFDEKNLTLKVPAR